MARRALQLDLGPRRARWPAWVLLGIGVLAAGDAFLGWQALREEAAALQGRQARRPAPTQPLALDEATQRELDNARQVMQALALPWEPLFRSVEAALDRDTTLLALEPDPGKRVVRIEGEARSVLAAIAFVKRLESAPTLEGVHMVSHQVRVDVAERPAQFVAAATWKVQP